VSPSEVDLYHAEREYHRVARALRHAQKRIDIAPATKAGDIARLSRELVRAEWRLRDARFSLVSRGPR
jgi:hypothetical protein